MYSCVRGAPLGRSMIMMALLLLLSTATFGQLTVFSERFSANDLGDIVLIGNTVLTCPAADPDCAAAQAGGPFNNNDFSMVYVDVDGDPTTFDSSTATLSLPAGSDVLFAGLYWTGDSSSPNREQVRFATPASGGYLDLVGAALGSQPTFDYAAFIDVTALVQAGGPGDYTVADVQTDTGSNLFGGWSLVVAARIPGEPPRNLTIFDGFQVVGATDITLPLSGFQTPNSGPVTTVLGIVSAEGDLVGPVLADGASLDGVVLSDANNPANNLFNSTISDLGVTVTTKNPNFVNQLGFDIDRLDASGILANSATSATVELFSSGDFYLPHVVTFATELHAPEFDMVKAMVDQNGGELVVGDVIEITVMVTNIGLDDADDAVLTDAIPANTTFVPGSLEIVSGANAGVKTDAPGDDQAEVSGGNVVFRLGTGADAVSGGTLVPASATEVRFLLTVDLPTPLGTVISNQAVSDYLAVTLGQPLTSSSNEVSLTVTGGFADLSVTKDDGQATAVPGSSVTYTIVVANAGPSVVASATVADTFPAAFTGVTWTCAASAGSTCAATGAGDIADTADLLAGGTVTYTATGTIDPTFFGVLSNTADAQPGPGVIDTDPSNNAATDNTTVASSSDMTGTKEVTGNFVEGGTVTYVVVLTNNAATAQFDNPGDEFVDVLPSELTLVAAMADSGTVATAGNTVTWNGSIPGGAMVTITIEAVINHGVGGQVISNQGGILYDADGDGTNESTRLTDDPAVGGAEDPTDFRVLTALEIPTLSQVGLAVMALLLFVAGLRTMRKLGVRVRPPSRF